MAEQQQQRVHFYHQDNGSSSSESRLEAPHCPSMEGSASVDQSVNTPTPPGGGSVDRMVAMHTPDHPQQSTSTKVTNSQRQPCMITGEDINQGEEPDHGHTVDFGDMPTLEEHQALEQAELAMSDVDDNFLCVLHTFKLWHGAGFPPSNIPYDKDLDGHIISQVQHVEAGQYMVDMINLLEKELDHLILVTVLQESFCPLLPACFHAYLRCQEDQVRFQDEVRQILLGAFWMINQISHFIPNWMPRSPNKYVGFVFPWWVDRSPQYHAEFQQMMGTRIFPIAHEYFQWLPMGDRIDEWMEENVSAYMIVARSAAGEIERNSWAIDHLFLWWFALSRLLDFQDA
ncbi:hypothetical protein EDD16DRAFT_1518801 [Pisolithus croceorrhizus]|nr:hypothetical protein EDD16DRAFT_1518801 [Pisolithus croceorrhizus]